MNDARVATRSLARTPDFTLTVLLTLALGVGSTLTISSVVGDALLRMPDYPAYERLVQKPLREHASGRLSFHWPTLTLGDARERITSLDRL